MRKRIKTITEEIHEHGSVALENWLLATILGFANSPEITKDHVAAMIERAVKLSEAGKGRTLTVAEDLVALAAGTPVAEEAASIAYSAV
jgi:TorA maturation chaperone TorD